MARPKSNDKRNDILAACYRVIARDGLDASTATIAKEADVASGSLFTYFPTKAVLYNDVYVSLKTEMIAAAVAGINSGSSDHEKMHNVWTGWMNWALADTDKQRALDILRASDLLTPETKAFGAELMKPTIELIERCGRDGTRTQPSLLFINATMGAIANTTMNLMISDPDNAALYRESGFEAVWKLIS